MPNTKSTGPWPSGARAAISFTMDNMGEAADLTRNLWPDSRPIGQHYSATQVLPAMLELLKKYNVLATYFIESWNINVYGDFILGHVAAAGHEIGWHAWRHEPWARLTDEEERENFKRSFGPEGIQSWLTDNKCEPYCGFRPPGGIINGDRTLNLCREFGLRYISPAGEEAATVKVGPPGNVLTVLPFKWATVDAYFYMESFAGLRKMRGEYSTEPQSTEVLMQRYRMEIDKTIESGGFLSVLFHPFLTNTPERLEAMEFVLRYLNEKRDAGEIWLTRCKDVDEYVRKHPNAVGQDARLDLSSWC
ncbi:hypothetical protein B0T10DRAFT_498870 [Thelonectria olida]|uniref:chitin deacetylase n=1 Tax=Thelonectria olida TaxID=1576542 RepID=A0A9P9AFW1_9HYPO|nr:hypothetical protein B0T10DRAFT_498870 [Thelonectria olida]